MKRKFILRLDDACETMDREKWNRIENLLDKYGICPIVGVIPHNEDSTLILDEYDNNFWSIVRRWKKKKWSIALHGYNHVYISESLGINPIHRRSEFAGVPYDVQKEKIKKGYEKFLENGIEPKVFFSPSHTFDEATLDVLKECTNIKIISDTIANDIYYQNGFYFVPQQSGRVRNLPLKVVTFCYHPNTMQEEEFFVLENFLKEHREKFINVEKIIYKKRKLSLYDKILRYLYFKFRR